MLYRIYYDKDSNEVATEEEAAYMKVVVVDPMGVPSLSEFIILEREEE